MKRIVTIGGGTGSYTVLRGLKKYNVELTAVVNMTDDGGSTGRLRDEFGILPPGDVRRCIAALSDSTEIMKQLFQYRFMRGSLKGHSFGNLFITALKEIMGSDEAAIKEACKILSIRGQVLPITLDNARLCAELENGQIIEGETNIDLPKHDGMLRINRIFLKPAAQINNQARNALLSADLIVIGPGDLYGSIIANLIVGGVCEALRQSKAKKVYVCNLMTKFGETNDFCVEDFVAEVEHYLGDGVLDYVIFNNVKMDKSLLDVYAKKERQYPVLYNLDKLKGFGGKLITANLISGPNLIRHDPDKLAKKIVSLL